MPCWGEGGGCPGEALCALSWYSITWRRHGVLAPDQTPLCRRHCLNTSRPQAGTARQWLSVPALAESDTARTCNQQTRGYVGTPSDQ